MSPAGAAYAPLVVGPLLVDAAGVLPTPDAAGVLPTPDAPDAVDELTTPDAVGELTTPDAAGVLATLGVVGSVPTAVQLPDTVDDSGSDAVGAAGSFDASQLARGGGVVERDVFLRGTSSTGGGVHGAAVGFDFGAGVGSFGAASSGSGGSQLARGGFFGGSSPELTGAPHPPLRAGRRKAAS